MRTMKGLGALAVAALTAWIFLAPAIGAWAFAAAEFTFLAWLARELRKAASKPSPARESLEADEAEIVQRYPLYFQRPAFARECASTLGALGLASLVAVPWLTYKLAWLPAILVGVQLFAVARLTKLLSPVHTLRLATAKGDRDALRLLSAHDGAMRKVSAPDQPGA
jgi:hypothetical protein